MAGEDEYRRSRPPAQPGGRRPAPGRLALVQAFINTHYDLEFDHGAEVLESPPALADWLARRELVPRTATAGPEDLLRALDAREALRRLAGASATDPSDAAANLEVLDRLARGAPVEVRFGPDGPGFASAGDSVPGAIGVLLAISPGDRRRHLDSPEGLPRRAVRLGLLRPLPQQGRPLVRDVGLRRPGQGPRPLPPSPHRDALRCAASPDP